MFGAAFPKGVSAAQEEATKSTHSDFQDAWMVLEACNILGTQCSRDGRSAQHGERGGPREAHSQPGMAARPVLQGQRSHQHASERERAFYYFPRNRDVDAESHYQQLETLPAALIHFPPGQPATP